MPRVSTCDGTIPLIVIAAHIADVEEDVGWHLCCIERCMVSSVAVREYTFGSSDPISVVAAVSGRAATSLQRLVTHEHCRLIALTTVAGVVRLIRRVRPSVILTEASLPDGTWRDVLDATEHLWPRPLVIITCEKPDQRLWADVLSCGAYDVLAQPFDQFEVAQVINSAARLGKLPCARGQSAPTCAKSPKWVD
jgi:DNA-binding NarL/FixJ family response regulator